MSSSEPLLRVERLGAAWDGVPVLADLSFDLAPGEFLALLGPNGSGKTTLLRCLAGLEPITAGAIELGGRRIERWPPHRRGIGLMSQEPALFPGRSVLENVAFAPLLRGAPAATAREEVARLLALLHLEGFEERRPDQLSGGERQRVALARTLAARPTVVLLDEPFASIDVELRAELRAEFRRVLREIGTAAIHVTHDREEGLFLGDRVGLLFDGRLETIAPPAELFGHPTSVRAARLLGYNVLDGRAGPVAVHPTDLRLGPSDPTGRGGTVWAVGTVGRDALVAVGLDTGERLELRGGSPATVRPGDRVAVRWDAEIPLPPDGPAPKSPNPAGGSGPP
ncbi:MAG TPA: ABC transporter ATP-binding protein [Thermoplasmata archaeon]|nr:ABC transporter ATP-binding protein [Thermoplasmata archaeon]